MQLSVRVHTRPCHVKFSRQRNVPVYCQNNVIVIGGGAAGLTAAYFAAENGSKVTVLERTPEAGKKILMSGGSRCNVLPVEVDLQRDYFTSSPKSAMRAVFSSWNLWDCKYWIESPDEGLGIELAVEEETNKYFPASNSSKEVRNKLLQGCLNRGVVVKYDASVEGLRQERPAAREGGATEEAVEQVEEIKPTEEGPAPRWVCKLKDGTHVVGDKVVVATGGLSFPAVGTDGTGHRLLKKLGHAMHDTYPALTPLTGSHPAGHQLAGISMYSLLMECQTGRKSFTQACRQGMLFTHRGFSGPSVLDLSHHAILAMEQNSPTKPALRVNWTGESPDMWEERLAGNGALLVSTVVQRAGVRERLAEALCDELGLDGVRISELRKVDRQRLLQSLTAYELHYDGHEGYKKAEVTGGGVPLTEIDCRTMASTVLPGLYLCGEVVDVFGRIGGFNFYWAWVSGRLAGLGAAGAVAPSPKKAKATKATKQQSAE